MLTHLQGPPPICPKCMFYDEENIYFFFFSHFVNFFPFGESVL